MYQTIDEIKTANKAINNYFFSDSTIAWFNSEVESDVINNQYFVTSERQELSMPKRYTVRVAHDDGTIDTVGEFQEFDTLAHAIEFANALPENDPEWTDSR